MRRHPNKISRVNELGHVAVGSVGNHGPDPSKRPVVVRGTGGASHSRGEEGLAIGADGRGERAMDENLEQSPSFSRSSRVAP